MDSKIKELYELWVAKSYYKKQLQELDEESIIDCFYKELEFGTGGIRGVIGPGTNRLNIHIIKKVTYAYGLYLKEKYQDQPKISVAISYDNRRFSKDFALSSASTLSHLGIHSYIFDTLHPTPLLSFAVRQLKCCGGIMITASHNPKEYNGYKVYNELGGQLVPSEVELLLKKINSIDNIFDIEIIENSKLIHQIGDNIDDSYLEYIYRLKDTSEKKIKIVYTALHGTGYQLIKKVFDLFEYDYQIVEEQAFPSEDFINTVSANPEDKAAYNLALDYAKKHDSDLIIATDPDCDRVGIVVKDSGEYHYLTGNETGALLIYYLLKEKYTKAKIKNTILFDTIVTSPLGREIAKSLNVESYSTLTGFKFIAEQIEKREDKAFIFGYEESYGYLILPIVRDKDAVQATTIIAEMTNYYKLQGITLVKQLDKIYKEYGYYLNKQLSFERTGIKGAKEIASIMQYFEKNQLKNIDKYKVITFEDYNKSFSLNVTEGKKILDYDKSDVIRLIFEDNSIIAIRPSGTEPKIKIYILVKDDDLSSSKIKLELFEREIKKVIEKIIG